MALSLIAAFWVVSTLCALTPGIDWAYVIAAGMNGRVVLPAVSGILLGQFAVALIVAAGVGALVASHPITLTIISLTGAAYLLWMGYGLLRQPATARQETFSTSNSSMNWALKGACVSGLNPKVFLLFLALLPQFIDQAAGWSITVQIIILALIHIAISGVVYMVVGFSAKAVLQARPRAATVVSHLSGGAMITIAAFLIMEHVIH